MDFEKFSVGSPISLICVPGEILLKEVEMDR